MFTIDIDTGGTFTDGFFTRVGEFKTAKVLTTPHDLTVCLADCIKEGATRAPIIGGVPGGKQGIPPFTFFLSFA